MTLTIAIANNKGGTAKTTTTLHLARLLAAQGLVTVAVDLDGQANLTSSADMDGWDHFGDPGIVHLIRQGRPLDSAVYLASDNLYICPASPDLNDVADEMSTKPLQLFRLKNTLAQATQADIILIDCPPNLGPLTYSALIAAQGLIIPSEPAGWSIDGLQRTADKLEELQREIGHAPRLLGTIATKVRADLIGHRTGLAILNGLGVPLLATIPRREGKDADAQLAAAYQPAAQAIIDIVHREPTT